MTQSFRGAHWGEKVSRILGASIAAVNPYAAVTRCLQLDGEELTAGEKTYDLSHYKHIYVVGAGKAGLPMAQAVVDVLGDRITAGQVTVKEGHAGGVKVVENVRIAEAGHPLPDERGVKSTQEILDLLAGTTGRDLVICLISGGGSALLTAPVAGVTLEDLRSLTDSLLACGATITEINTLRKQLDRVKGGGLVTAAAPAQVLGLILSDVVGDPLDVIASGPTVPNLQTTADALAVIEKYDLASQISPNILAILETTTQLSNDSAAQPYNCLVGCNETAARAAITHAQQEGFNTEVLTTTLQGEARDVGRELAGKLRKAATGGNIERPFLMIAGGETTVTIQGDGAGGRNQEMALAAVGPLAGLEDVAFIALATDGGDGPTDAAGAVVTGEALGRAQALGLDPSEYLANNDSYTFFSKLGDCLMTGPTQTNVNDLVFLFAF